MRAPLVVGGVLLAAALAPAAARAQGAPNNPGNFSANPHPTMPWGGVSSPTNVDYGTPVRYVIVPAQPVTIEVTPPVPEGVAAQKVQQVVEIPSYQVVETTTGYYYPERWTLERANVGVYQWRKLPAEFRRKP
ncbi:MAG TPA: hypothetical protein VLI67_08745 [Vicinamibacteria bacterium]|nr:hypothetical protein [Vicinamibacteria bacterium]